MVEKCGVNVSDGRYDNIECAFGHCGEGIPMQFRGSVCASMRVGGGG